MPIDITGLNAGKPQGTSERKSPAVERNQGGSSAGASAQGPRGDTINLTATAARLKQLEAGLVGVPVVDESKVQGVQRAITSGTYSIDAERVAEKMIDFERQLTTKA